MNLRILFAFFFSIAGTFAAQSVFSLEANAENLEVQKQITKITYILPNDIKKLPSSIEGLNFRSYESGNPNKMERLIIYRDPDYMQIERRTDNGVAGSGTVYDISINVARKSNLKEVILTVNNFKPYQEGLIFPFPIPEFDIKTFLASAYISYDFELDAKYQPTSVQGNLERNFNLEFDNKGKFNCEFMDAQLEIKLYPHQNDKTKVRVSAIIYNRQSTNGAINVAEKIKKIKLELKNIINS